MSYTTYLFDFDYTLADSSRGIVTCFRNVLNRHGYTEPTDEDIKRTIGKGLEESFTILSGVTDEQQLADFKSEYRKEADTHMTVNTVLFLETKSVLIALKDAGVRIGIISTKYRYRIKELLDQHFPGDFLDIIIGGEDVKEVKPSPEGLLLAIKQLHVNKSETLYIGDSTIDAETARAAGVDFAGITHGVTTAEELCQYPHKRIMSTLEELLEKEIEEEPTPIQKEEEPTTTPKSAKISIPKIVSKYLRLFHIKVARGRKTPPNTPQSTTCLNCGNTYIGNYCNRCGQNRNTPHYRLDNAFKNIMGAFTNIDNGFGRTLIELLYRPGHMIRDFINGRRIHYFRPFQTLFVLAALYIMCVQLVDPDALRRTGNVKEKKKQEMVVANHPTDSLQISVAPKSAEVSDEEDQLIDDFVENSISVTSRIEERFQQFPIFIKVWDLLKSWGHGNKAFSIVVTLPLFALATILAFRRKKNKLSYNFTEHVFVQAYIACQMLLISIIILPFNGTARTDYLYEIPKLAMFVLFWIDYKQLYRHSWWGSFWRTALTMLYALLILIVLAILIILFLIAAIYLLTPFL